MAYRIAILGGDGIGPEVTAQAVRVLDKVAELYGFGLEYVYHLVGGCSTDKFGTPITEEAFEDIKACDAVLLGAVGGQKWDNISKDIRPEKALFKLRSGLGLFANLRPILLFDELKNSCPIKSEIIGDSLDLMIVRELTSGIYFGKKWIEDDIAYDTMTYSRAEIERIIDVAIDIAKDRKNKITCVDKANVLETSRLWREVFTEKVKKHPMLNASTMLVDNAAMQIIRNPHQFDVIVTGNLFGDILSDEASMLTGSIGMLPSASISSAKQGMYEPVHGSAPDIAGKGIANPIASILSVAMMLRFSFGRQEEAKCVEKAVKLALASGARTADIAEASDSILSTESMCDSILSFIIK